MGEGEVKVNLREVFQRDPIGDDVAKIVVVVFNMRLLVGAVRIAEEDIEPDLSGLGIGLKERDLLKLRPAVGEKKGEEGRKQAVAKFILERIKS